MRQELRAENDTTGTREILDKILDGCIAFDPRSRILLGTANFTAKKLRIVVAPERRHRPFIMPASPAAD